MDYHYKPQLLKLVKQQDTYHIDLDWVRFILNRDYRHIEWDEPFPEDHPGVLYEQQVWGNIEITQEEVDRYIQTQSVEPINQWCQAFKYYILFKTQIPLTINLPSIEVSTGEIRCLRNNVREVITHRRNEREVLNKHNPFADVSLEHKSFLIPTNTGYKALSFNTGEMGSLSENETYIDFRPSFNVELTPLDQPTHKKIRFDDSVIYPLEQTNDEIYIVTKT